MNALPKRTNCGPDVQISGVIHREDGYANQAYSEVWMTTNLCQGGNVFRFASPQGDMANPILFGDTPKGDAKRPGNVTSAPSSPRLETSIQVRLAARSPSPARQIPPPTILGSGRSMSAVRTLPSL